MNRKDLCIPKKLMFQCGEEHSINNKAIVYTEQFQLVKC